MNTIQVQILVFKCRKILTFSDSEEEQEEEEGKRIAKSRRYQSFPKSVAVAAVKPTAVETGNTQLTVGPDTKSRNSHEDEGQVKQQNHESLKSRPSQAFYVDLHSPVVKTPETQVERQINISDIVDMDDKNDSGNNSASPQNRSALSTGKRTNASSERSGSRNISFELNQSDLSNYSADSASRRRPSSESGLHSRSISSRSRSASPPKPCTSQNSYDLIPNNTDNHLEMLGVLHDTSKALANTEEKQEGIVDSPSRERSPPRPISAFFVDAVGKKDHAYFPQFQPPRNFETRVETVTHISEYNYGVPVVESSPKAAGTKKGVVHFTPSDRRVANRKSASGARNRDERIRVCVRKRPLWKKESKRQEADIVTTQDCDIVVVEESKVTIDLSKCMQKV